MITIVDYNAGNLRSVKRACDAVGIESRVSSDADEIANAARVIFPGIGHAKTTMDTLVARGLDSALTAARSAGAPILGICVGAQLLLDGSDEGPASGFGWIPGQTRLLEPKDDNLKVPHIGWNDVCVAQPHPLLEDLREGDAAYFVHGYFMAPTDKRHIFATSEYGENFCCAIGRDNVFATQFHPEKSGRLGLSILKRFATWNGKLEGQSC